MECGKITFVRFRGSEYYKGERLNHISDSFYHLCNNYIKENVIFPNPYDSYNVSLVEIEKNRKNIRKINAIEESDVIIIPTEVEFAYHIYGRISNIMLGRSWTMVQNIREGLFKNPKPRKVILLSSDKSDTIELFRNRVFHDIPNLDFYRIDESEFPGGVHHLKYLAINDLKLDKTKTKDFAYWGTSKRMKIDLSTEEVKTPIHDWYDLDEWKNNGKRVLSQKSNGNKNILSRYMGKKPGEVLPKPTKEFRHPDYPGEPSFYIDLLKGKESKDERHIILKQIYGDESISNNFIGYFDGFKYTHKYDKNMTKILPHISECNATLCFNWPGQEEHLTARYNEALGCDVIPLVWKDYDCNNQLVYSDWQRCYSFDDVEKKCLELRDNCVKLETLKEIKDKYEEVTKSLEYYEKLFNKKLNEKLNNGD